MDNPDLGKRELRSMNIYKSVFIRRWSKIR
jgi:hypothetical protein